MNGFFNPDNWLWRSFGKIFDFFGLSCMWFLCSMPLITVGTASIALYDTAAHCLRGTETNLAKRFFSTFKKELIPGILITILWAVIAMLFWFGYQIVYQMGQADPNLALFAVVYYFSLLIPVGVLCWVFAVESRFVYRFFQLHKMSLYFTFAHLPATIAVVVLALIAIEICLDFPFMVIFVPGILVYLQSFFIERVFRKYMPEEQTAEVEETDEALAEE
ncbi:MAG: DUF624 domain-containing protein [Oscillospiraceae bacterium]|nr:DUF624 domain-containing protein [Oscillospiraceae bacterium]